MALLDEFQNSLDRAIARTTSPEFDRLRAGLGAETIAGYIHTAMEELRKLQQGRMPDYYNPWVAPFYTSWYQPGQVNLAYTLIREMMGWQGERLTCNAAGNLCVVDFGCGASATRFGLTLAVAHAIQDGQNVGRVEVYGTDISQPMVEMGERLWATWGEEIANEGVLRTAYETVRSVNTTQVEGWVAPEPSGADSDRWLIALHTAYQSNSLEVRRHLRYIANAFRPRAGFVTSHVGNQLPVRVISPYDDVWEVVPMAILDADCYETTDWRSRLCFEFAEYLQYIDYNYLDNQVSYDVEPFFCLLHVT